MIAPDNVEEDEEEGSKFISGIWNNFSTEKSELT